MGQPAAAPARLHRRLFERFDDIDRDGDGFISLEEIDVACASKRFTGQHAAAIAGAMARDRVAVATTKEGSDDAALTPDGLHRGHAYSILGFGDGVALLRDPQGDSGPGPLGQVIEHGVFTLPLPCFPVNFSSLAIEG